MGHTPYNPSLSALFFILELPLCLPEGLSNGDHDPQDLSCQLPNHEKKEEIEVGN
jgi:hypothetical protein